MSENEIIPSKPGIVDIVDTIDHSHTPESNTSAILNEIDFSKFSIGSIYNGTIVSALKTGVSVDINEGM